MQLYIAGGCGDQGRKGSATNTIQIAELLLK